MFHALCNIVVQLKGSSFVFGFCLLYKLLSIVVEALQNSEYANKCGICFGPRVIVIVVCI